MEQGDCQKQAMAGLDAQESSAEPEVDLFCEKCFDLINYFIDECQTLSPRLGKLSAELLRAKQKRDFYKRKSKELDFDFEEMKALKEEAEERFAHLLRLVSEKTTSGGESEAGIKVDELLAKVASLEQERVGHLDALKALQQELGEKTERIERLEKESAQLRDINDVLVNQTAAKMSQELADELAAKNQVLAQENDKNLAELARLRESIAVLEKANAEYERSKQQACMAVDLIDFDEVSTKTTTTTTHNEVKVVGEAVVNELVSEVKEVTVDERHLKIGHVAMETSVESANMAGVLELKDKELAEKTDEVKRLGEELHQKLKEFGEQGSAEINRLTQANNDLGAQVKALQEKIGELSAEAAEAAKLQERITLLEQENKCLLEGIEISEETIAKFSANQGELERAAQEKEARIAEMSAELSARTQELERLNGMPPPPQTVKISHEVHVQTFDERGWKDQSMQMDVEFEPATSDDDQAPKADLEQTNEELKSKLEEKQAELEQTRAELANIQQQLSAQIEQNNELRATVEARNAEVNECLASLKSTQEKIEAGKQEQERLANTVSELQTMLGESRDEVTRLTAEIDSKSAELAQQTQAFTEVKLSSESQQTAIREMEAKMIEQEALYKSCIEEKDQEIAGKQAEIEKLQAKPEQQSQPAVVEMMPEPEEKTEELKRLSSDLSEQHEARVKSLEAEIAELKASLESAKEEKRKADESLANEINLKASVESELAELKSERSVLKEQLEAKLGEYEALETKLEASVKQLQEENQQLASTIDQLNQRLQTADEEMRDLAQEKKRMEEKYDESEAAVGKLLNRLTDMEQSGDDRLRQLNEELANLERAKANELHLKQQELAEKIEEISRLSARLAALEQDLSTNRSRWSLGGQLQLVDSGDDESMDVEMTSPDSPQSSASSGQQKSEESVPEPPSPQQILANETINPEPNDELARAQEKLESLRSQMEALEGELKQAREGAELSRTQRTERIIELASKVAGFMDMDADEELRGKAQQEVEALGHDEESIKTMLLQFGATVRGRYERAESVSQGTIAELRTQIEEMTHTFKADLDAKQQEIDAKIDEINALNEKISDVEARIGAMSNELAQARDIEADQNQKLVELNAQIEAVNAEMRDKLGEIDRLTELVAKFEAQLSKDIDQYKSSSDEIQQLLSAQIEQNNELRATVEARNAEVNECLASLKSTQEKIEAGKQEQERLANTVSELQTMLGESRDEVTRLTAEIDSKSAELAQQTQAFTEVKLSSESQQTAIREMEAKMIEQEALYKSCIEEKDQEIAGKQVEIGQLQERLVMSQSQLSQTSQEIAEEMSRLKELHASDQAQMDELRSLNARMSEEFQAKVQEHANTLSNLAAALEASKAETVQLSKLLEETALKLAEAQETNQALQNEKAEFEKKIKKIETDTKYFIENTTESINAKTARIEVLEAELEAATAELERQRLKSTENDSELNKVCADFQMLVQRNQELEGRLAETGKDREQLRAKLAGYDEIKNLELATMRQEFENNEMRLSDELSELRTRHENLERTKVNLEASLKEIQADLSNTRRQMIEYENELTNGQSELKSRVEQEKEEYIKKAFNFERKYVEESEQNVLLQQRIERMRKEMQEREHELHEETVRKMEAKSVEIGLLEQRLAHMSKQYDAQLNEAAESQAKWMHKLSEESRRFKELYEQYQTSELKLGEAELANQKLNAELTSTKSLLAEVEKKAEAIRVEKSSFLSEQEARGQDLVDLQRRLCDALTEKEELFKDIIKMKKHYEDNRKEYLEAKQALEGQVASLEKQLAQQQQQMQSKGVNMNESLMLKIDRHIDSNIQAKLDDLLEQRHRHLIEIEHAKKELEQLKAKMASEIERLNKEHQKAIKEKQHQHEKAISKQLNEIKKLQETNKEMQETNDYLAKTIDNLNKQIFELNAEKENENGAGNDSASMSMSLLNSASKPKQSKKLFDATFSTPAKPAGLVNKHLLTVRDTNKNTSSLLEPGSPAVNNQSADSMPKTPSSAMKKPNNCAQQ